MKRLGALLALATALVGVPTAAHADDEFYAVRSTPNDQLFVFDGFSTTPREIVPLTGLVGAQVVALDQRWSTGGLYGVTRAVGGTSLRVVRIDQTTGAVTPVGPVLPSTNSDGVGFDIHPTTNVAYVYTSGDNGWGVDLTTGALATVPVVNPTSQDVIGSAWSAPSGGAVIGVSVDSVSDQLRLGIGGSSVPFGPLGVDVPRNTSLDISPDQQFYLETQTGGLNRVYVLDGLDGRASQHAVLAGAAINGFAVRLTGDVRWVQPLVFQEGETAQVTLVREAPASGPAVVTWQTLAGTAAAGSDFVPSSGTVTFQRGQTTATVSVPIIADAAPEPTETFQLQLASPDGVRVGPAATVRIADDDVPGAPGTAGDTTAPVVIALPVSTKPAKRITVPFGLGESAKVTATLTLSATAAKKAGVKAQLGQVILDGSLGANKSVFTLKGSVVRKLKGTLKGTVTLVAVDGAGNTTPATAKVTLKRPRVG